jgi:hypothetical protein
MQYSHMGGLSKNTLKAQIWREGFLNLIAWKLSISQGKTLHKQNQKTNWKKTTSIASFVEN